MKLLLEKDGFEISKLLTDGNLVPSEIDKNNLFWFGIKNGKDGLIAVMGIEVYNDICFFRSLTVRADERNKGLADKLICEVTSFARDYKCIEVYLITSTIADMMKKYGFNIIDRKILPEVIKESPYIKKICPVSSLVMHKKISC